MSWVWEVFDSNGERVIRISGDEKAGTAGRDAWQAVNDDVLARAARSGMEQLSVYFRGPDSQAAGGRVEPSPNRHRLRSPAPSRPVCRRRPCGICGIASLIAGIPLGTTNTAILRNRVTACISPARRSDACPEGQ